MATTEKIRNEINGKGPFDFDFPYLNVKDVQVELNGEKLTPIEDENLNSTPPKPHQFTRETTQIKLVDTPVANSTLRIYRTTDDSNLNSTFYPGSAIRSHDLNDNFTQNLYATQENTKDATLALDSVREWDDTLVQPDGTTGGWNTAWKEAEASKNATDALVGINTAAEGATPVWVTKGHGVPGDTAEGVGKAIDDSEDALEATDALVGKKVNNVWETRGHGVTGDAEEGVGKALDNALEAKNIAIAADNIADDALEATDALVGKKDANGNWYARGHGAGGTDSQNDPSTEDGVGKALDDSAYAVSTADTAKDTYAIPASTAATAAKLATDTYVHDGTNLKGDGISPNPQGLKYAVNQVNDWIINGDGTTLGSDNATHEGVPYAVQQSTDAVADATAALANSRNTATPPVSAIFIAEDAYDNAVRQSSDPNWSPSGGTESAIRIAEAAEVTADLAEGIANTASANATAAQNAVTNAELFTPYATVSDIPDNNVSSITVAPTAQGAGYTSTPAVTIGVEWTVATVYSLNDEVFNGSNIYLVTTAGTSAAAPSNGPTGTGSSIGDGTVTWEYKGPKATATAVVTDEKVTSITVTNKGNHYTGTPTVTIAAPPAATPPATAAQAYATAVMGPLNEEKAEVADSTGLSVFTPLTDIPAGFGLGDTGLTAKLKYDTSTTPDTWKFISYYANDAEIRYWKKIVIENQIEIDRNYTIGDGNNAFGVGPVSIANNKILTIPNNSTYLVL